MRRKILVSAAVLLVLALLLPLLNLLGAPSGTALARAAGPDARDAEVGAILEKRCGYCHVPAVKAPFYASLPVASSLVEKDVRQGLHARDRVAGLFPAGAPVDEVALAKVEHALESGSMPPGRFMALHWNGGLGVGDRETVLAWIRTTRAEEVAPPGIPEEARCGVVHPLPEIEGVDARRAALGEKLYHDVRLSGDDTVSCATCHDLAKGGTDQAPVSTGVRGQKGGINAPTTFNAGFQFLQFWDGRAADLREQAGGPPLNPVEMDGNWEAIGAKLAADPVLSREFLAVYPAGISAATITAAIAAFERTLVTPGAPFDRFLLGEEAALSPAAGRGWDLFRSTGCATCHCGVLLGGRSFEPMGRREDYFGPRGNPTPADDGRMNVTGREEDRHHFKVPTLRNVERTFPYFHDGSVEDLGEAIRVMARVQLGKELSPDEEAALKAFLGSLTGTWRGKPL